MDALTTSFPTRQKKPPKRKRQSNLRFVVEFAGKNVACDNLHLADRRSTAATYLEFIIQSLTESLLNYLAVHE